MRRLTFLGLLFIHLVGCSATQDRFDCSYQPGVGCKAISEVNKLIDQPAKPVGREFGLEQIQRISEQHLVVWLAPHQDPLGQFHEATRVHTVLRPGFWQTTGGKHVD